MLGLGVLVNVRNVHWTCIAKKDDILFYTDSISRPVVIDEGDYAGIISVNPNSFLIVSSDCLLQ